MRFASTKWMRRRSFAAAALLMAAAGSDLRADDTDIYIGRIAPPTSEPLVMFTLDTSSALSATYGGCSKVGVGPTLCNAALWFQANCPSCTLPAADQPLTIFDAERLALRMVLLQLNGVRVGLMLSHADANDTSGSGSVLGGLGGGSSVVSCAGPRPSGTSGIVATSNRCSNGAYVARGFKSVDHIINAFSPGTVSPGPNLSELLAILDALPEPKTGVAQAYQGKEVFFELFRYLTGQGVYNGHNGYTDYGTDNALNLNQDNTAIDWDAASEVAATGLYLSPLTTALTCARIYTVNMIVGGSTLDNDSDTAIKATGASGGMPGIVLPGTTTADSNDFRSMIAWMYAADLATATQPLGTVPALDGKQNVTSYFFTRPNPVDSNPPAYDAKIKGYAVAGGTGAPLPISDDPATLVAELRSVANQILAVSTTFVSASAPVNTFNRTQTLGDVFVSLFQPDLAAKPWWNGNVKKLHAQTYQTTCAAGDTACTPATAVKLVDVSGSDAVDADGRIKASALTYWTDGSTIAADPANGVQAGKDGRTVWLGGAGQKIPGFVSGTPGMINATAGSRQLYFYPGTGSTLLGLNADAATATQLQAPLGATTSAEALNLLTYLRGYDPFDVNGNGVTNEVRPWLMADPLHSRPIPVNYGAISGYSQANPAVYVAVATNDGLLHYIRNTDGGGAESGVEQWAFIPIDLMNIEKLQANNVPVNKRAYGFDGTPTAWVDDKNSNGTVESGDRVYLYTGMRRGGRAYYALNVTDPATPKFLWKVAPTLVLSPALSATCTASYNAGTALSGASPCALQYSLFTCTGDFCELGYTFSQPRIGKVQAGVDSGGAPVIKTAVFFGGGYDLNKDYTQTQLNVFNAGLATSGSVGTDDTMGNALYVVDAETGALIWKAVKGVSTGAGSGGHVYTHSELRDSIPAPLTLVDTDGDGVVDRIVAGDTGGNVWRADLGGPPSQWKLTLLAKLGRHAAGAVTKADDRRFFNDPDFVQARDEGGAYDAVIVGSGDREDPLDYGRGRTVTGDVITENAMYVIKDRQVGVGAATESTIYTPASLADVTSDCLQTGTTTSCGLSLANGWRLQLRQAAGEKLLSSPLTASTRVFATTYLPPTASDSLSCAPSEGRGLFYALSLQQGTAVFNYNAADGGTATAPNSASDRFQMMNSPGIPTDVAYLSLPDPSTGREARCLLGADLNCRSMTGATRFRTFWNRVEP